MTDKELLEKLMEVNSWTQERLASEIGFDRSNISKVINERQKLGSASRKLAEMLLRDTEKVEI